MFSFCLCFNECFLSNITLSIGLQLDLESENLQDFAVLLPISESPFPAALDSGMCSLCYFYQKQVSFGVQVNNLKLNSRCLSNGEIPPVKERLEYPLPETWYGLTPGK